MNYKQKVKIAELEEFARKNGLQIHPNKDWPEHADKVLRIKHCPCDVNRPECPCDECLEEVKENGNCKCTFFVNNDYMKRLNSRR